MFLLAFSLLFFEAVDVTSVRDSTIQQILDGEWAEAIENAKFVLVHEPEDYLLLGLIQYGRVMRFISKLNPKFSLLINERNNNIIKTWGKLSKDNYENKNTLQVLAILSLYTEIEKTQHYVNKIIQQDSLNSFAYFLLGFTSEQGGSYNKAITYYRKAFELDTTFTDCLATMANMFLLAGNYDSALVCFRQIPYGDSVYNSMHIGEIICLLKNKNITDAQLITKKINELEILPPIRNCLTEIETYIEMMQQNNISSADTFFTFVPMILKRLTTEHVKLGALLTSNDVQVFSIKTLDSYTDTIPYYAVEIKPKPINIPLPEYPQKSIKESFEGKVVVRVLIDTDGSILDTDILVSSGINELDNAAVNAAKMAKFEPAIQFGRPVRVWVSIPYNFRLQ